MLIEVAFKGNRKEFFLWEGDEPPPLKAAMIVEADRGEDLGYVHAIAELAEKRYAGVAHGAPSGVAPRPARRLAGPEDVRRARELREQDEAARRKAMERVKANGLVMKLSDAEWQWDRKKLTFYFTAERRVDFRSLVRDLAALFRTRIELKQIGVRDEAKRLDGIGRCGRQYCSASWLPELRPVNLGVAKDQHLSLNPSQISGACGRLMCCLRYEHEFYAQSRKRFPKEGKILVTAVGEEKVIANDIFNDRVTLRNVEGETRLVPLAQLRRELAGDVGVEPAEEEPPVMVESLDPELISMQDTAERPAFRPGMPRPELPVTIQRRAKAAPRPQPAVVLPPPVLAPVEVAPAAAETAPGDGDPAAGRAPRRRRGRRGGRRGRGGQSAPDAAGGTVGEAPEGDAGSADGEV